MAEKSFVVQGAFSHNFTKYVLTKVLKIKRNKFIRIIFFGLSKKIFKIIKI
jgi:hypothetical protein